jgi:hypothetical protein
VRNQRGKGITHLEPRLNVGVAITCDERLFKLLLLSLASDLSFLKRPDTTGE